jgi:hypothetical protein
VGFTNREENLKLSNATHQLMRHIAKNSMEIGLPIMLESNFNPSDADYFEGEIQKYGYKPITIQLTGDKKVLFERFMARWEDRHWGHKSFKPSWEAFETQQDGWVRFNISGEKLIIDTTDFDNVCYDEIVKKIEALHRRGSCDGIMERAKMVSKAACRACQQHREALQNFTEKGDGQ